MRDLAAAAARRPGRTTLLALLVTALALAGASRLRLGTDLLALLPVSDPSVREFKDAVEDFGFARRLLVAVEADTAAGLAAAAPKIEAFYAGLASMPGVRSVEAGIPAGVVRRLGGADGVRLLPEGALRRLRARLGAEGLRAAATEARTRLGDADGGAARDLILADPLDLRGLAVEFVALRPRSGLSLPAADGSLPLLSEDGRMRLAVALAERPPEDIAFSEGMVRETRERFDSALGGSGLRLVLAGAYPVAAEASARMRFDLVGIGLVALLAVHVLSGFLFRSVRLLLAVGGVLVLAVVWTAGAAGAFFGEIHVVSVGFASTLVGLGINFGLHVSNAYAHGLESALAPPEAVAEATRGLARGLLASAATTAGAFAVLLFSSFRGYAEFGVLLAVGVSLACASALLVLPAWLGGSASAAPDPVRGPARRLGEVLLRRRGLVRAGGAAFLLACAWLASGLDVRTGTETLRPDLSAFAEQERVLARFGNVVEPLVLVPEAATLEEAIRENDALFERLAAASSGEFRIQSLRYFLLSAETAARARSVLGDVDPGETSREWKEALRAAGFREAYAEEQAGRLRRLIEGLSEPPPGTEEWRAAGLGPVLEGAISAREGRVRLATTVYPEVPARAAETLARVRDAAGPGVVVTGLPIVRGRLGLLVTRDLGRLGLFATLLLLAILAATIRSLPGVLVSLVPFVASALGAAAALRLAGRGITVGNLAVFPLLTGMADDYGIHLWLRFRRDGDAAEALSESARALLTSGGTTILGFGSLVFAAHPALRDLGLAAAVGVAFALAASLLLVPALLPSGGRYRTPSGSIRTRTGFAQAFLSSE
ncbi:MAG: MMPL family transporter [Planctomycetes bacterium]|nr:MMPL family transporter [Planctomycetota bacterium]